MSPKRRVTLIIDDFSFKMYVINRYQNDVLYKFF